MSRVGKIAFLYDATYTQKRKQNFQRKAFSLLIKKLTNCVEKKYFFTWMVDDLIGKKVESKLYERKKAEILNAAENQLCHEEGYRKNILLVIKQSAY